MKSNLKLICLSIVRRTRELDPEKSQSVYSLLKGFRDGEIHRSLLISVVSRVFSGHDHLLRLFESILPHDPPSPNNQEGSDDDDDHTVEKVSQKKKRKISKYISVNLERATEFINKVSERFPDNDDDDGIYSSFLDALSTIYDKYDGQKVAAIEVTKELNLLFTDNTDLTVIDLPTFMADEQEEKEPWESKERKRKYEATQKPKKKHPCEEMSLKIEEDQFECDMSYYPIRSTRKIIQNLVEDVKEGRISMPIVLENHLPVIYLRCIERVYGMTGEDEGYGQDVIEKLRENPIKAGDIVLRSLYQKEKEIKRKRRKISREVWAKALKDCHEKGNEI